jgi:hypothetical protein
MKKRSVYDLIAVFGAIVLFSAWVFQQTSVEKQRSLIAKLDQADAQYQQYQSSNAIFNALIETQEGKDPVIHVIRRDQTYNYGLGLVKMSEVTGITPLVGYDISMDAMQKHLERVQAIASAMRQGAQRSKDRDDRIFFVVYGIGSMLALLGSVLKLTAPA